MTRLQLEHLWQRRIHAWRDSGLSGAAYAEREGISYHQFVYWRRKLDHEVSQTSLTHVRSDFARVLPTMVAPSDELTLTLPNGIVITRLQAHNVDLLGDILRQL